MKSRCEFVFFPERSILGTGVIAGLVRKRRLCLQNSARLVRYLFYFSGRFHIASVLVGVYNAISSPG